MDQIKTLLATTNQGKLREVREILRNLNADDWLTVISISDSGFVGDGPDETGGTFAENALIKARYWSRRTRLPALADDSGLCVDALGGEPGIRSARWTGPAATDADRTAALLDRLADVPDSNRTAEFVCAVAFVTADGDELIAEGRCAGTIVRAVQGSLGFGYDPIFRPNGETRTFAEQSSAEKNRKSHRFLAIAAVVPQIRDHIGASGT